MSIVLFLFCCTMFFFVIWRFFSIFHNNSKIIPLIIAVILAIIVVSTFMYMWNSKVLDIIWTLSTWIFVIWFILMILLLVEYLVSTRYKINPRIIVWIIVIIFWLWTYFSLHTKTINLNLQSDKIENDVKILFVSDIHAEHVTSTFHINKIIKTIETQKPDFVIIAWDLMNKPNTGYLEYFSAFKSIKDTPIFAVMWNHDVMWNPEIVKKIPEISGIKFLNNENLEIAGINLIWIIDKSLWGNDSVNDVLNQVELKDDSDLFSLLVTHQPIKLEKLEDFPIDLEVAWHTHRGQFYWMHKVVEWVNDYAYGEYKLWDKIAFVTQWIWTWWLPFRLWSQSEIVIINLIKK